MAKKTYQHVIDAVVGDFFWKGLSPEKMKEKRSMTIRLERIVEICVGFVWALVLAIPASCGLISLPREMWLVLSVGIPVGIVYHKRWRKYGEDVIHLLTYHINLLQTVPEPGKYEQELAHIRLDKQYFRPWWEFHLIKPFFFLCGFALGYITFRFFCNALLGFVLDRSLDQAMTWREDILVLPGALMALGVSLISVLGYVLVKRFLY